jgi:hypothetical protein
LICSAYDLLRKGVSRAGVQRTLGISADAWYDWVRKGREGLEPYGVFHRVTEVALGMIEQEAVQTWVDTMPNDWRASEAFLKTRFPQEWNPTHQVEVAHGGSVQHDHKLSMSTDDLMQVADILRTAGVLPTPALDSQPGDEDTPLDVEIVDPRPGAPG